MYRMLMLCAATNIYELKSPNVSYKKPHRKLLFIRNTSGLYYV